MCSEWKKSLEKLPAILAAVYQDVFSQEVLSNTLEEKGGKPFILSY